MDANEHRKNRLVQGEVSRILTILGLNHATSEHDGLRVWNFSITLADPERPSLSVPVTIVGQAGLVSAVVCVKPVGDPWTPDEVHRFRQDLDELTSVARFAATSKTEGVGYIRVDVVLGALAPDILMIQYIWQNAVAGFVALNDAFPSRMTPVFAETVPSGRVMKLSQNRPDAASDEPSADEGGADETPPVA